MSANPNDTAVFKAQITSHRAKLEVIGSIMRFATPLLITVGIYYLGLITDTVTSIEVDVAKNRIAAIKIEARQNAFLNTFNNYRENGNRRIDEIKGELEEVNDELDHQVGQVHKLDVKVHQYIRATN